MTIKELVECATFVQNVEIVIRTTGLSSTWIQGYRIGPKAKIYPYEYRVEERERRPHKTETLKPGEEADVIHSQELPLKVIAVDPKRMPEAIANLKVRWYQPRHLYKLHGEQLTHNDFDLDIVAYPPDTAEELKLKPEKAADEIEGQMNLEQFYTTEHV